MKKWAAQVDAQRRVWRDAARASNQTRQTSTSATEFTYMQNQGSLVNPYQEEDDGDDGDYDDGTSTPSQPYGYMNANGSNSSLRSRAGTGDSIFGSQNGSRVAPARFPMLNEVPPPVLQLQTRQLASAGGAMSPSERNPESYFSPTAESPISTRTSSSSNGMYPFTRQATLPNGWHPDDNARFTAPAMGRTTPQNGARGAQRPSLPPSAHSAHGVLGSARLRSASSPDIQNPIQRGAQPPVPEVPVPPFPNHYAYAPVANRSQPNLPNNPMSLPTRSATQSPTIQRDRMLPPRSIPSEQPAYYDPRYGAVSRGAQPFDSSRGYPSAGSLESRRQSPPSQASTPAPQEIATPTPTPTQLKVKVHCPSAGSSMTLVVGTNISYQSLKDRIDAKLQRSTNVSLSTGQVKLKYLDDGDYISMQSDEDVQTAFESWREQQRDHVSAGQLGEIELYCQ